MTRSLAPLALAARVAVDCAVERVEIDAAGEYPDVDRSNNVWPSGEAVAGP